MQVIVRQPIVPRWRHGPAIVLGGLTIALSVMTALVVARSSAVFPTPLIPLVGGAAAAILLSFGPETLFLSWLALAPFLQESAGANEVGRVMVLALYISPPLVLALWTVTRPSRHSRPRFIDALPAGYFLYVLTSLALTSDVSPTSVRSAYTTIGIGIVLYYFLAFGPIGSLSWEGISAVLMTLCAVEAAMSVIDGLTGWNLWHDTGWQDRSRAIATLVNPSVLGTFIAMGMVVAVSTLVWQGPMRIRTLAVATIAIGVPGLFFTFTRAPIIAAIAAGVVVLASRPQTRVLAVGLLATAAVVLAASWSEISSSELYRERVSNESTVQIRLLVQHWSVELFQERPLFGWGHGSFDRVKNAAAFESGDLPATFGTGNTSHNTFLTILVEHGAVGLGLLLVPFLAITWGAVRNTLEEPRLRWFLVGSLAALGVYLFTANASDRRFYSFLPALAWLFLGLLRRHQLIRE